MADTPTTRNPARFLTIPFAREQAVALVRIWLGAMMIMHGYGKVFGGMERFTESVAKLGLPMPEFFAWAAALSEFAGGIALILGLAMRPAAAMIFCTMAVAAFIRHADDPFKNKELPLTYLVISVALFLIGPGPYSLDSMLSRRRSANA